MPSIQPNAIRIKRFRELKETLRTQRDRLLVGIDIAKAAHVAQVRLAPTRILEKRFDFANTGAGFERLWAHLQTRRQETGVSEIVCAVEPTGTYHEALAQFLEAQGVDVVLVSNTVAHANRRTLDGTWGKSDPKDAHNLGELLERGMILFYSLPDERVATLRRLVRLLRRARTELAACKARFQNTLLPNLGPAGEALPAPVVARLPAPLPLLLPRAGRTPVQVGPRCPRPWPSSAPTSRRASSPCGPASPPSRRSWSGSPSPSRPTPGSAASRASGPRSRQSSWPRSGTSSGTPSAVSSGSSRGWTSSGWRQASGRARRGSRRRAGRSCAGPSIRRPSAPPAPPRGAPAARG